MPIGLTLNPDNRWIKRANSIPWDVLDPKYALLFEDSTNGNIAFPFRLAFGSLIIKTTMNISDEEVALQIQENPYLQYFCGLPGYTEDLPFNPCSMVRFRQRLTPEILQEINEIIISAALEAKAEAKKLAEEKAKTESRPLPRRTNVIPKKHPLFPKTFVTLWTYLY